MEKIPNKKTLSIAIMSGKGGVGKTNVALNLGYCLYKNNHPLLLIDCDLGLANLDVLLNIIPDHNIRELLESNIDPQHMITVVEPGGFDLIPAASGVPELTELDEEIRLTFMERLSHLFTRYDYFLLDLSAGISQTILSFAALSHLRIVIITPEPASLTDSYAAIKVLATQWSVKDFYVIINMIETELDEKLTFQRLNNACERFLGFSVTLLGAIRHDRSLVEAVRRQIPLMKLNPNSKAGQDIFSIALKINRLRYNVVPTTALL